MMMMIMVILMKIVLFTLVHNEKNIIVNTDTRQYSRYREVVYHAAGFVTAAWDTGQSVIFCPLDMVSSFSFFPKNALEKSFDYPFN